jgi:hypothetical protein
MSEEFDNPLIRKVRKETREKSAYADSKIEPGLRDLMDQARDLFADRILNSEAEVPDEDADRIFDECLDHVAGAREAFEIWDKLYDEYQSK